jgi:hypothetical protein
VGASRVPMMLKRVVLPHPEGPIMETASPSSMVKETPFKAFIRPLS